MITGMINRGAVILFFMTGLFFLSSDVAKAGSLKLLGGPAWGRYSSDGGMTNSWKPGGLLGVGVESGRGLLSFEADLCYMMKTNSYNSRGWDYELGEISVPFLAKIRPFDGRGLFLLAGGELAYVLSHKQKPGPFGEEFFDMMDNTRRLDYGLVVGFGFGIDVGGLTLEASGRYHHGLAKVSGLGWKVYDLQTRALAVVAGVLF
jgi:hypothetical protein